MPIKKDENGKRWVEMEVVVPGTPEQVWQALATGPGNSAWFTKTQIDEHVGGTLHFDFGSIGSSKGEVTVWEPPVRFGYVEREWNPGAPPVATEITVTSRAGGKCLVRMVHSLFAATDDWDDQLEGFESGWPGFFDVLRLYLAHFAGQHAAILFLTVPSTLVHLRAWKRLLESFGIGAADVGETVTASQGPEPVAGVIERVQQSEHQRYVILRLTAPAPGIALLGIYRTEQGANVSTSFYFYGEDAEERVARAEAKWQSWFGQRFQPS